jgi:hypothetical protein
MPCWQGPHAQSLEKQTCQRIWRSSHSRRHWTTQKIFYSKLSNSLKVSQSNNTNLSSRRLFRLQKIGMWSMLRQWRMEIMTQSLYKHCSKRSNPFPYALRHPRQLRQSLRWISLGAATASDSFPPRWDLSSQSSICRRQSKRLTKLRTTSLQRAWIVS